MSMSFTIYATALIKASVEEKEYKFESWVVDDFIFNNVNSNPLAMACLVTLDQVKEKFPADNGLKHKEAEFLVLIKKSVDDMATPEDISNLETHELIHYHLGHGGKESTPALEDEAKEATGDEIDIELHLFGLRWLMLQGKKNPELIRSLF